MKNNAPLKRALYRSLLRKAQAIDRKPSGTNHLWLQDNVVHDYKIKAVNFSIHLSGEMLNARIMHRIIPEELQPISKMLSGRHLDSKQLVSIIKQAFRTETPLPIDTGFAAIRAINEQLFIDKQSSVHTSRNVRVTVQTMSEEEPLANDFDQAHRFCYRITVENIGTASIRVLGRHWEFGNKSGVISTVPKWGPGVIGLKPVINPGEAFIYMSSTRMPDSHGWMEGALLIENYDTKEVMDVTVAKCNLIRPPIA